MAESTIQRKVSDPEYATQSFSTSVSVIGTTENLNSASIDVTKSGYTAVGIISATTSGSTLIREVSLEGNIARCKKLLPASWNLSEHRWVGSSGRSETVTVTVKYIKNN